MRGAVFGILAGTALAFSVAQPAAAVTIPGNSSISLSGSVIGTPAGSITNATSLDFTSEVGTPSVGTPGTLDGYGTGTGAFTGVSCLTGSCGSIKDIASLVTGPLSLTDFFILTGGTNSAAIHFDLASIDSITRPDPFLLFSGSGMIRWGDFSPTAATFLFSAQGNNITSFSATALTPSVPEPTTWALMLLGFGGIGMAMRRRRRPALAQIA